MTIPLWGFLALAGGARQSHNDSSGVKGGGGGSGGGSSAHEPHKWDPERTARTNQDHQREREETSMRLLIRHLTRKNRPLPNSAASRQNASSGQSGGMATSYAKGEN